MIPELKKSKKAHGFPEIPPGEVRATLDKVVASDAFGPERPTRFLRHLVEFALRGEDHRLKESLLGVDVFDRPPDWDPREVPVVRQEAARLRKRLEKYYANGGAADPIRIELPVGTYVPVFRRSMGEVETPESAISDVPIPNIEPLPVRLRQLWPYAAAAICCIAITLGAWRAVHPPAVFSVAVLPFTNLSGDPADQYFVDGLTDEVTDSLVRLKTLRVIARSSANVVKKQPRDLSDIARQLHVSHVVEAGVERSGDNVKVVASLVRTADGARIWTNTYRRHSADLALIQGDLAEAVRSSLGIAATAARDKHVPPDGAHRAYLKARFEESQYTAAANLQAESDYRRAIEIDPNYAPAYAGLAAAIWNQNIRTGQSPLIEDRRKSQGLYRQAIEIDPTLASAHSGLAMYAMQYDWDWNRAERELKAALSWGENAGAENNYALLCQIQGRRAEAEQHRQLANDLDPANPNIVLNNANYLLLSGRLAEAREELQKVAGWGNAVNAKIGLYGVMAQQGQTAEAIKGLESLPQGLPSVQLGLAEAKAAAGARDEALALLAPLEQNYRENRIFMSWIAGVYAAMDDEANTVKWLERSMDAREGPAMYIHVAPIWAKMQNRPAFRALKKRMGLDW
jgi:TolB-like protein/Tfp pilus assembly protein PilF